MNLVVIYGPPASGKLTVAREVAKIAGYRLFHNHLTIELLKSILPGSDPEYIKLRDRYRKEMIELAARKGIAGVVFTYAYGGTPAEDRFLKDLTGIVGRCGGNTYFVQLHCSLAELRRRVKYASRRKYDKIKDVKALNAELASRNVFAKVGFADSLRVDNTAISPNEAAGRIIEHYSLSDQ